MKLIIKREREGKGRKCVFDFKNLNNLELKNIFFNLVLNYLKLFKINLYKILLNKY